MDVPPRAARRLERLRGARPTCSPRTPRCAPATSRDLPARRPFRDYLRVAARAGPAPPPRRTGGAVLAGFDGAHPAAVRPRAAPTRTRTRSAERLPRRAGRRRSPAGCTTFAQRAPADAEHGRAGRVGAAAVPLQRPARRVLRRDRVRPAGRPARRRRRSSACSSTRCRCGSTWTGARRVRRLAARAAGRAGRGPAVRARAADPAAGAGATCPAAPTCSTASWCSRTTRSTTRPPARTGCGCATLHGDRDHQLPAQRRGLPGPAAVARRSATTRTCSTPATVERLAGHLRRAADAAWPPTRTGRSPASPMLTAAERAPGAGRVERHRPRPVPPADAAGAVRGAGGRARRTPPR